MGLGEVREALERPELGWRERPERTAVGMAIRDRPEAASLGPAGKTGLAQPDAGEKIRIPGIWEKVDFDLIAVASASEPGELDRGAAGNR
jgi:hypothetical protein